MKGLRAAGASVAVLAGVGFGVPDLLVGWRGVNILMEIKNLEGRGDRLTQDEANFMGAWQGQAAIVHCLCEAMQILNNNQINISRKEVT